MYVATEHCDTTRARALDSKGQAAGRKWELAQGIVSAVAIEQGVSCVPRTRVSCFVWYANEKQQEYWIKEGIDGLHFDSSVESKYFYC